MSQAMNPDAALVREAAEEIDHHADHAHGLKHRDCAARRSIAMGLRSLADRLEEAGPTGECEADGCDQTPIWCMNHHFPAPPVAQTAGGHCDCLRICEGIRGPVEGCPGVAPDPMAQGERERIAERITAESNQCGDLYERKRWRGLATRILTGEFGGKP
jgi:hypothetical protein